MTIRPDIIALQTAQEPAQAVPPEELISVSSATRRIAFAYERFRNTLEPDEEDVLRRKALFRILERRLMEDRPTTVTATAILQELIRAHYIRPVSQAYITRFAQIIGRSRLIYERLSGEVASWFLQLVAVALDREIFPRQAEETLVYLMYTDTLKRAAWSAELVAPTDRETQLYMACHRALFAADNYEIAYHYFRHHFPAWRAAEETVAEDTEIVLIARDLPTFYQQMQRLLQHPSRERLTRLMRPVAVPYRILRDIIQEHAEILNNPEALEGGLKEAIKIRMRRIRERMATRAWHSILFLFFTKTVIAFLVEVPYDLLVLPQIHWFALAINVTFHPILLFLLATTARLPGQRNTDLIMEQVKKILAGEELGTIVITEGRRYGAITWSFFAIIYAVLFMAIFWLMFAVLDGLGFSIVAMFMFVIFLGLVSFLAIRIRHSVDEIRMIPRREGAVGAVFSFLSLPILEFGRWLAQNLNQVNFILFFMDRILEAPFKLLIDVTEEWFDFVRDRREEII